MHHRPNNSFKPKPLRGSAALAASPGHRPFKIIGIAMQVHLFRGPGRVFGFTSDLSGANLPPQFAPWSHFKSVEMRQGEPMAGVDVDECLADLETFGMHVTDAHVRIPSKQCSKANARRLFVADS